MFELTASEEKNYYDILEIEPDASPSDIREAYLRAKAAFRKDSTALYSLMSTEETTQVLNQIEEAFRILSNPEARRDYDQGHGSLRAEPSTPKVVSIDRNPPMDPGSDEDWLLAPTTDFSPEASKSSNPVSTVDTFVAPQAQTSPAPVRQNPKNAALLAEIDEEQEWRGPFLRRVREARGVTLEELSEYTKISRTYLNAIEDELYEKLPAPVFLRGFVTQVAKYLKIPADKAAAAYIARYNDFKNSPSKAKSR